MRSHIRFTAAIDRALGPTDISERLSQLCIWLILLVARCIGRSVDQLGILFVLAKRFRDLVDALLSEHRLCAFVDLSLSHVRHIGLWRQRLRIGHELVGSVVIALTNEWRRVCWQMAPTVARVTTQRGSHVFYHVHPARVRSPLRAEYI